jgi:hypothetical protein
LKKERADWKLGAFHSWHLDSKRWKDEPDHDNKYDGETKIVIGFIGTGLKDLALEDS